MMFHSSVCSGGEEGPGGAFDRRGLITAVDV